MSYDDYYDYGPRFVRTPPPPTDADAPPVEQRRRPAHQPNDDVDRGAQRRAKRDAELARRSRRRTHPPLADKFDAQVVGVAFRPDYPTNLETVRDRWALPFEHRGVLWAELVRDWHNRHDPNAVAVYVHGAGLDDPKIGHLNKVIASRLAPELDAGIHWTARVLEVGGDEHIGISIRCLRKGPKTRPPRVGTRRRRDTRRRQGMKTRS